jgi:MoaA/NifB/PqqE/SkfB family radical SAM enzyme
MYKLKDIKTIHMEVTQACQASCSMCDRNQNGGALNPHINLDELTLEDCQKIFPIKLVQQLKKLHMCGNLGDPIIARDTLEIFKYFRQHNPTMWLSMNTNAGARDHSWWTEIAHTMGNLGHVVFSVDGLEDTNHLYRQGVKWSIVENSMRSFIAAGGRARWEFLIFDYNQHQIEAAEKFSQDLGFEKFIPKKSGRFVTQVLAHKVQHQAVNRKGEKTVLLKRPDEKFQNPAFKALDTVVEKYGDIETYYDKAEIVCKVKDDGNLFITAEGLALPCCWTAGRMYKWFNKDPKTEQIWRFIERAGGKAALDARNGLDKVFDTGIFDMIEQSWTIESCSSGKLKVCSMKCGKEIDLFKDQYK